MNTRIVGGTLLLCVTICYVAGSQGLAQTPEPSHSPTSDAKVEVGTSDKNKETKDGRDFGNLEEDAETTQAEDLATERAIRAQSAALIAEYNAKNASALAARFLSNAEYEQDDGEVTIGRRAIREYFEECFSDYPDVQAQIKESRFRLISQHMAIEEGIYAITDEGDEDESLCRYVSIWSYNRGQWLLASVRELATEDESETPHDYLESLGWLVGEWVDKSPEKTIKSSCRWSDDLNFLLLDYTIEIDGEESHTVTERIGWDPLTHTIRAWLFDSHGGHGESTWNWDGERWVIRSSEVHVDGTIVAAMNCLIPISDDEYRWETSHRMSDDEALPDINVVVVRRAAAPEAAPSDTLNQ